jgi:hypothetical protein
MFYVKYKPLSGIFSPENTDFRLIFPIFHHFWLFFYHFWLFFHHFSPFSATHIMENTIIVAVLTREAAIVPARPKVAL